MFLSPQWLDRDCDHAVLEDWVSRVPHVATFLSVVVHRGFLLRSSPLPLATLVPKRIMDPGQDFESVLDVLSVIYINSHLPREQQHCWRLLFSSQLHGHSFSQLCGRMTQRGPCVTLLEDHDGHVFGGFASCSWEVKPQFQGEPLCASCCHHGGLAAALVPRVLTVPAGAEQGHPPATSIGILPHRCSEMLYCSLWPQVPTAPVLGC